MSLQDTLIGTDGNDTLAALPDGQSIFGRAGDDSLTGSDLADLLVGEEGNDTLRGLDGDDRLLGGAGRDRLEGGNGDDVLDTTGGDIESQDFGDYVRPGLGNDTILGHVGLYGVGSGTDLSYANLSGVGGVTITSGLNGTGTAVTGNGLSSDQFSHIEYFEGTQDGDLILGSDDDRWEGFAGLGGADTIDGGAGQNLVEYVYEHEYFDGTGTGIFANLPEGFILDTQGNVDRVTRIQTISGSVFGDTMISTGLNGTMLIGNAGNDYLFGGAGNETLDGGEGNDTLLGGLGSDELYGGAGNDSLNAGDNTDYDYIAPGSGLDTVTFEADVTGYFELDHGDLDDGIVATINGITNTGIILKQGAGSTTLFGVRWPLRGDGLMVVGTDHDDTFNVALAEGDYMMLQGGAGQDSYTLAGLGAFRMDFTMSEEGITLNLATRQILDDGFGNAETLNGFGIVDQIRGSDGDDFIIGSAASERFDLRRGNDTLDGGGGIDMLRYDRTNYASVVADLSEGIATGSYRGSTFRHSFTSIENIRGSNAGADTIFGSATGNRIEGFAGNDTLNGWFGNDTIDGGAGADLMIGGPGSDVFHVDDAGDVVLESRKWAGIDHVMSSVDFRLASAHVENLSLTGTAYLGAGNGLRNVLRGNGGDNLLDGGPNVDTLIGGAGNDTYFVRSPGDTVIEAATEGLDTVRAFRSYTLENNVERLFLQTVRTKAGDVLDINGFGNRLDNVIIGNPFDNVIAGREGRDTLQGQAGADAFVFDRAYGGDNVDRIIDFNTNEANEGDTLMMRSPYFGGLAVGTLDAELFVAGTQAQDANDRFIFDRASGQLWFDADGTGAADQQLIATFERNALVTASDIEIF